MGGVDEGGYLNSSDKVVIKKKAGNHYTEVVQMRATAEKMVKSAETISLLDI